MDEGMGFTGVPEGLQMKLDIRGLRKASALLRSVPNLVQNVALERSSSHRQSMSPPNSPTIPKPLPSTKWLTLSDSVRSQIRSTSASA